MDIRFEGMRTLTLSLSLRGRGNRHATPLMSLTLAAILLLALAGAGWAPVALAPPAWPGAGVVERGITYCVAGGQQLQLDAYYPARGARPAPAVLYVHGGAWSSGDRSELESLAAAPLLAQQGYFVASIDYRLAPEHRFPAQLEDVRCAVRFLRARAGRFGIDPERIAAWGSSAGGHLVSLLGTAAAPAGAGEHAGYSSSVRAVINMFGPCDLPLLLRGDLSALAAPVFGEVEGALLSASPLRHVSSGDAAFLILHGEQDDVVPLEQSRLLQEALAAAGVPVELVTVAQAGHGFGPQDLLAQPSYPELLGRVVAFLDLHLR
ncbi:MAG: alpha/beta hydrolase fold domain-containing protein [Chloroflexota bacterium]